MNKFAVKYQNTAKKMHQALTSLLEHKNLADITVSEICKEAHVNRTTFYLHYNNIYDLMRELATCLFEEYLLSFGKQIPIENYRNYRADDLVFNTPKYLVPFLEFIQKNKTIFQVFVQYPNVANMEDFGGINLKQFFTIVMEKNGIQDQKAIHYMTRFYLSGMTAIILEWLKDNCRDDILSICEIIALCTRQIHNQPTQNAL